MRACYPFCYQSWLRLPLPSAPNHSRQHGFLQGRFGIPGRNQPQELTKQLSPRVTGQSLSCLQMDLGLREAAKHSGRVENMWDEPTLQHTHSWHFWVPGSGWPQEHLTCQSCEELLTLLQTSQRNLKRVTVQVPTKQQNSQITLLLTVCHYTRGCLMYWHTLTHCPRGHEISPKWYKKLNWKVRFTKEHSLPLHKCVFGEYPNCMSANLLSDFNQNWKNNKM